MLSFETMPGEGVDAVRILEGTEFKGVLWFSPFYCNAEVHAKQQTYVLTEYDDLESLVTDVIRCLRGEALE